MQTLLLVLSSFLVLSLGANDPNLWKAFLMNNRQKQCSSRPDEVPMPLSFYIPGDYFGNVPTNMRVDPSRMYTQPEMVPACNAQVIQPEALNAYSFQSEQFMATLGLNIYDGAVHSMAISLVGEYASARQYEGSILVAGRTCQFTDIKADKNCKGIIRIGQCNDTLKSGVCGFCYGQQTSQPTLTAWTFRFLCDYWSLEKTIDLRCPDQNHPWIWNDYKPVLGENAWSNLIAPLQVAYITFGKSVENIPANDMAISMGLNFLTSLPSMVVPGIGAVYYAPKNTLDFGDADLGYTVSTENNISLLAGLRMLRYVLLKKGGFADKIALIDTLIAGITQYIHDAYDPSLGYFRSGGQIDPVTNQWSWYEGPNQFAVDCQTWTMTVMGPQQVDAWYGSGTAAQVWLMTKKIGGFHWTVTGNVDGLGFSNNSAASLYSGEWTLGGVNMLNLFSAVLGDPKYAQEGVSLRNYLSHLVGSVSLNNIPCTGVQYANKRYWIPFGWFANSVLSTASTSWAVFIDSNWNPFYLGGGYGVEYPS